MHTSTRSRRGGGALEKQLDELRAFAQANNEVQRKVLGSLYCPDPTASSSAKLLERSSPAAKEAVKLGIITEQLVSQLRHAPSVPLSDTHDLALRVLLIFEGNAFFYAGDDRDDEGDDSPYDCGSGNSGVYTPEVHTSSAASTRTRAARPTCATAAGARTCRTHCMAKASLAPCATLRRARCWRSTISPRRRPCSQRLHGTHAAAIRVSLLGENIRSLSGHACMLAKAQSGAQTCKACT